MSAQLKVPDYEFDGVIPIKFQWTSSNYTTVIESDQFGDTTKWKLQLVKCPTSARSLNNLLDVWLHCLESEALVTVEFSGKFKSSSSASGTSQQDKRTQVGLVHSKAPLKVVSGLPVIFYPGTTNTVTVEAELKSRVFKNSCAPSLYTDLTSDYTDCEIVVGGEDPVTLPAHRGILAVRSSVFAAMFFGSDCSEKTDGVVVVKDLTRSAMEYLLKFMYTGVCGDDVLAREGLDIFKAADKYDVQELRKMCVSSLNSNLNSSNAAAMLYLAETCCVPELRDGATNFIIDNFVECEKTDEWKCIEDNVPKLAFSIVKIRALRLNP